MMDKMGKGRLVAPGLRTGEVTRVYGAGGVSTTCVG